MLHRTLAISLAAALSLPGCAAWAPSNRLAVQALVNVRNGGVDAEGMYFMGRAYQGQRRHEEAARAFLAALALEPHHAEARNALGATYFEQGRVDLAEQQFRLAIASAPDAPHLRKNLARLYALSGRQLPAADAIAVEAAPPTAPVAPATSAAPVAPVAPAASAVAAEAAPAQMSAAQEPRSAAAAPSGTNAAQLPAGPASGRLQNVGSNVWELTTLPPALPAAAPARLAASAAEPVGARAPVAPLERQRVEVSNGNGVPGLARRVAQFIETQGYRPPRTNNLQSFNQRRTELQYRIGSRRQARELAVLLTVTPRLVAVTSLERAATVRLVLGRDFKEPARVAGAAPGEQLTDMVAMLESK